MRYIQADHVFDGKGDVKDNQIIQIDESGTIQALLDDKELPEGIEVEKVSGAICPGFINTHCHLELSHMKGLVDTGTTLLPFLRSVVTFRDFPQEIIIKAIKDGDEEMWTNGIVAVGDISNKVDTAKIKSDSPIKYYTFVEMFDFLQDSMTKSTIQNYETVFKNQADNDGNKKSYVPHAPYTVTKGLFDFIKQQNTVDKTISIHNQETVEEDLLFLEGKSEFIDFFAGFGFSMDQFVPTRTTSIHYSMQHMNPKCKTIQVHNTKTTGTDIQAAHKWSKHIYWATCPNANLYIENNLPNYQTFIDNEARMTIGTDSLTSNWKLSIASEILTIQKYCSYIPLQQLMKWACYNGAEALGYDHLGSFEIGKTPGINQVDVEYVNGQYRLVSDKVTKLI